MNCLSSIIETELAAKMSKSSISSTVKKRRNEKGSENGPLKKKLKKQRIAQKRTCSVYESEPPAKVKKLSEEKKKGMKSNGKMKYIKVCGVKRNSQCIYVPKQQLMYVKNSVNKHSGKVTYICYNYKQQKCTARVIAVSDSVCKSTSKSDPHICVGNHKQFRRNCQLLKNIKERAIKVNKITGTQSCAVSLRALIDEEKFK